MSDDGTRVSAIADEPSADELARIDERHLIRTRLEPADLLLVFGTREGVPEFLATISMLWSAHLFRYALVSGGPTWGMSETECTVLKRGMVEAGIPSALVLEEHRATNTGENVLFSLPIIDRVLGRASIRRVACLGKICTSRRYPMTLHRHWPEVEKLLVPVNYFPTPRARWREDDAFRHRVVSEWRKIEPYKARGFIVDWEPSSASLG